MSASEREEKATQHNTAFVSSQPELSAPPPPQQQTCIPAVFREKASEEQRGATELKKGEKREWTPRCCCLLSPGQSSPFPRFSSCIFITGAIHSSAGRVTSASHRRGGGGGCHVKHPHPHPRPQIYPPNLWNRKCA